MKKTIAIFAHFDPDGIVDANTLEILRILALECDEVDFVTTAEINLESVDFPSGVNAFRRPNIGYDFYSYKSGLVNRLEQGDVGQIFLVNSSFLVLDSERLRRCLQTMKTEAERADLVGVSVSYQMGRHLQSYLLLLGAGAVSSPTILGFVNSIQPQNAKIDLILSYEIGLTKAAEKAGLHIHAVFDPLESVSGNANPVHANAQALAQIAGIVKTEVLRNNQHGIDTRFVELIAAPDALKRITPLIERYRDHYTVGTDQIASLRQAQSGPPQLRFARWGRTHQPGVRIAVALHMFYSDLAEEFCSYLSNIIEPFDIYLTTPFEKDVPHLINAFAEVASSVTIAACENRGRDIGPFVSLLRSGHLDSYKVVLKLHSKKSRYSVHGDHWRQSILGALVGTSYKVLRSVEILSQERVGLVGPHDYYLTDETFWGGNRAIVERLAQQLPEAARRLPQDLGFFAGSMFWFKPSALRYFQKLPPSELDFEPENGAQDATLAHGIERALGPIVRATGFRTTSIYLDGQEIHDTPTRANRVPVL